jgi:hypothetical protein
MGYWELKDNLNPLQCLQLTDSNESNPTTEYPDNFWTVIDFIKFETKSGELTQTDLEHIYNLIKQGFTSGEVNDWIIKLPEYQITRKVITKSSCFVIADDEESAMQKASDNDSWQEHQNDDELLQAELA